MHSPRIVLVNTSHPGNIGAAARAMKTMGLKNLYLVTPKLFPDVKANEMASGALDILAQAIVVDNLDAAIADCQLVVGTSTRTRAIPWPLLAPREFVEMAHQEAAAQKIAILFGGEQSGLTNEELQRCHLHVQIPAAPEYSSLNLAAAVQIIAYEWRLASINKNVTAPEWDYPWASIEELEGFYAHLQKILIEINFLNPAVPRQLMTRLRRLFNRARLDVMEINILRGILGAVEKIGK